MDGMRSLGVARRLIGILALLLACPSGTQAGASAVTPPGGRESVPWEERIVLGRWKELIFDSSDGRFTLKGGDTLHCRWSDGVLRLNGKRYQPAVSPEEYWQLRTHTRAELQSFAQVPYIQKQVAKYGDTDWGWNRAFSEWDSLCTDLYRNVLLNYDQHPDVAATRAFMLAKDSHHFLSEVFAGGSSLKVKWRGSPGPAGIVMLPGSVTLPRPPVISREEAQGKLNLLRAMLTSSGPDRVALRFGSVLVEARSIWQVEPWSVWRDR